MRQAPKRTAASPLPQGPGACPPLRGWRQFLCLGPGAGVLPRPLSGLSSRIPPMLRTKVVCTLGPATSAPETVLAMVKGGMNMARINMSHGSHEDHRRSIEAVRGRCGEGPSPRRGPRGPGRSQDPGGGTGGAGGAAGRADRGPGAGRLGAGGRRFPRPTPLWPRRSPPARPCCWTTGCWNCVASAPKETGRSSRSSGAGCSRAGRGSTCRR